MDISQLVSTAEAAKLIVMPVELFRYYIKKDKTPEPIIFVGRKYFVREEILAWEKPFPEKPGRKSNRGEACER